MFDSILIANRGEIAVRIARTCEELGVRSVAVYSDVDARARHVARAAASVHLPGSAPSDTYLNAPALIEAARRSGAQAIHPGYGFLAENADFAQAVLDAGLTWIGPPPDVTRALGDKIQARNLAASAGVPVVPGLFEAVDDPQRVLDFGREHGFPVAIKAAGGGGGRGLKVARSEDEVEDALSAARRESLAYFNSEDVYVERYLEAPKHLEVQLLAPGPDRALWIGVRDCSLQRRHQKLIEETPPPRGAQRAPEMGAAAVALSTAAGYVNAGTVEMLVDDEDDFYFLEVNARLQVEHTVTEEIFGLDLVAAQLRIAAGDDLGFGQDDLSASGHAIECRINAEDPARGFAPSPGPLEVYVEPRGPGVRVDSGYSQGDVVPGDYDSLVAKVVCWGADREQARRTMLGALEEMRVEGVATTIPAHVVLLEDPAFVAGTHTTRTVEGTGVLARLERAAPAEGDEVLLSVDGVAVRLWHPAMAAAAPSSATAGAPGELVAPMQGTILELLVAEGDDVEAGAPVAVLEAMKMETTVTAARAGRLTRVAVAPGDSVSAGQVLAVVE